MTGIWTGGLVSPGAWRQAALTSWQGRFAECFNADTMPGYHLTNGRAGRPLSGAATSTGKNNKTINRVAAGKGSARQVETGRCPGGTSAARRVVQRRDLRGERRCVMPFLRSAALVMAAALGGLSVSVSGASAQEKSAVDAAHELAQMLDGASADISGDHLLSALDRKSVV